MKRQIEESETIDLPIDGVLDLHTFQPREVKKLVPDYLEACKQRGITEARIIHGKGTGTLRRVVHSVLNRLPEVISFKLAEGNVGGWGATIVVLKPLETSSS